jgi:hypothetical protein
LSSPTKVGVEIISYDVKLSTIEDMIGITVKSKKNTIKGEIITNIGNCSLKEPSGESLRSFNGLLFTLAITFFFLLY